MENKSFKRSLEGVVVGDKGEKTVVVNVLRRFKHRKYSKFVNVTKKYHAHDEKNKYVVASMKDESLYFFTFDYDDKNITSPNKVINGRADNIEIKRVHIGERIRDMIYYNEKLYLYLEDTASLAEVTIN